MSTKFAYKCKLDISYILYNEELKIDPLYVQYILIENLYETRYMPVIYLSMIVPINIYNSILQNERKGKFYLSISRYNLYSDSSIYKKYIEGQFTYILSNNDPNYSEKLQNEANDNLKTIVVALMSMDILNKSKISFNGIFGDIDSNTLISKALEGLNSIVKQPKYNPNFDTLLVPTLNNRSKLINFIFDKCPFYDTNYMFFMDFNKTYLLDLSGEYCKDISTDRRKTVYIDIRGLTDNKAYYEGIEINDDSYYIYINAKDASVIENKNSDKIANQIVSVHDDGEVDYIDLNIINSNIESEIKQTFVRGNDILLDKNIIESNMVHIEVAKDNIDSSILTPNKEFIIINFDDYKQYDGKYTLSHKKEIIRNIGGDFIITIFLGLKKVGNITPLNSNILDNVKRRNSSAIYRYSDIKEESKEKISNSGKKISKINKVIPQVNRMKATSNNSLKRTITKL